MSKLIFILYEDSLLLYLTYMYMYNIIYYMHTVCTVETKICNNIINNIINNS